MLSGMDSVIGLCVFIWQCLRIFFAVLKAGYIHLYLCRILGPELEIELSRNMEKFQVETQNPTHGPCWTSVSDSTP